MIKLVKLISDPVLRTPCKPVKDFAELPALLTDMHDTMIAERGIGIAANQIGVSLRVFIKKHNDASSDYAEYVNPEIVESSEPTTFDDEGCLSIPGTSGQTQRFNKLTLKWQDRTGTMHEGIFKGRDAQAIQHEMDHLNGKLYVDQFGPVKRELVLAKHKKFLRLRK